MSLTKNQLQVLNTTNFPNNTTGYITPELLRDFNSQSIDSMALQSQVDTLSASFQSQINGLEDFSSSLTITYATVSQLNASSSTLQSEINTLAGTASVNTLSQSVYDQFQTQANTNAGFVTRFNADELAFNTYTQSTDTALAGKAVLVGNNTFSGSQTITGNVTILGDVTAANLTQSWTSSFVSQTQFGNYTASVSTSFWQVNVSSSVNSSSIGALQTFSGSQYKTDSASFSSRIAAVTPDTSSLVTTASFNAYTQSTNTKIDNLNTISASYLTFTSSYYTTSGSFNTRINTNASSINTLNTNVSNLTSLTSSVAYITSSNTFANGTTQSFDYLTANSASITYLKTIYQTSSVVFTSGSNILGDDALTDTQTLIGRNILTGSAEVTGSLKVSSDISSSTISGLGNATTFSSSVNSRINAATIPTGTVSSSTQISNLGFINQTQTASMAVSSSTYATIAGNGGVTQLFAGPNITLSPSNGTGQVTISSTGTGTYYNTATGSYGSFYDTGSYAITSTTTAYSASINTTDLSNGVFISGSDRTKIFVSNAGVYNLQFSAQFTSSNNSLVDVDVWLRRGNDGGTATDLSYTKGQVTVPGKDGAINGAIIAGWNYFVSLNTNDYLELMYNAKDTGVALVTVGTSTNPTTPVSPSLILTAQRVDTFLSNTGSFTGSFGGTFNGYNLTEFATTASFNIISASYLAFTQSYYSDSASFNSRINAATGSSINTGSFATTGSNNFVDNQIISGSLYVSSSSQYDVTIEGQLNVTQSNQFASGSTTAARIVVAGPLSGTSYGSRSGSATLTAGNLQFQRGTATTTLGAGVLNVVAPYAAGYIFGTNTGQFLVGASDNATIDNEINLYADLTGTAFRDWDNTLGDYSNWLTLGPNDGITPPSPQLVRGLGVTGSTSISGSTFITGALSIVNNGIYINTNNQNSTGFSMETGSFQVTSKTGSFYTNLPITSSGARINGQFRAEEIRIAVDFNKGNGNLYVEGNTFLTGSLYASSSINVSGSINVTQGAESGSVITNVGDTFTGIAAVTKIISLTSAEYGGITPDSNTLYIII